MVRVKITEGYQFQKFIGPYVVKHSPQRSDITDVVRAGRVLITYSIFLQLQKTYSRNTESLGVMYSLS